MNGAQRAAFRDMVSIAEQMSNVCFNLSQCKQADLQNWEFTRETMKDIHTRWDAARARYFELEREAKQSRLTAQQMARKSSARKSG